MKRLALVAALVTLAGACSITESFDKPDGVGLGPDLTWERKVFSAQPHQWATLRQRAVYEVSGIGIHEDLQLPVEPLATDDQVVSMDVHEVTWNGTGASGSPSVSAPASRSSMLRATTGRICSRSVSTTRSSRA